MQSILLRTPALAFRPISSLSRRAILDAASALALLGRVLWIGIRGPRRPRETIQQMAQIGMGSLPIILFATAFSGLVVTAEMAYHMDLALHTVEMIPGFSGQFIFRELGVAVPALLVVAKVGASMAAETATMKVTEQIDALKLLRIDPIEYLVFPRFVACVVVVTCLTILSIAVMIAVSILVSTIEFNFSILEFTNSMVRFLSVEDLYSALIKGMTFGAVIPIISCFYGFRCAGGAQGVGSATTNAVVASTLTIIALDFILTYAFSVVFY